MIIKKNSDIMFFMAFITFFTSLVNAAPGNSLESSALNPWVTPLSFCNQNKGSFHVDINMGFLNTDYLCTITEKDGVRFDTKNLQSTQNDAARLVLNMANQCNQLESMRILVGASRDTENELRKLVPNASKNLIVQIQKNSRLKKPDENHAKVFQLSNGTDQFFTVHGSVNLQTVGLTCKANNALRFVEKTPALYQYFTELADAVQANNGTAKFKNGSGTTNSSGTNLAPVVVGNYVVQFYAGRADGFVGGDLPKQQKQWPEYLNPPISGQHRDDAINWYDSAIYDAARQLRLGRSVNLDVLVFEVGEDSTFVNNLWKFVQEGFSTQRSEDKTSDIQLASAFPGKLQVRFLYQFQNDKINSGFTFASLHDKSPVLSNAVAKEPPYSITIGKTWEVLNAAGQSVNPTTPYDMHNKLMLMDVVGHENERKLYVTSSNLDESGHGSGTLWQAGTIVSAIPQSDIWSGKNSKSHHLWSAYQKYFDMLWINRVGQPEAGQVSFHQKISALHSQNAMNWIETIKPDEAVNQQTLKEGIDAFFFPIPFVPSN